MGNKLLRRSSDHFTEESKLKSSVYCYISISILNQYILKLSNENTKEYVAHILKQFPVCINVKSNNLTGYRLSKHFRPINLTFEQLVNFSLLDDNKAVKIGISKFQYDYLELY
jgi:hypothetical protein